MDYKLYYQTGKMLHFEENSAPLL